MKLKAVVHPAEEGGYWAEIPALPGCMTEGESMDEIVSNLQEAAEGWLEVANELNELGSEAQMIELAI